MSAVRRAVIPAAGRGTRMRTLAGGGAKELLPVGDAPMLVYALIDCMRSGIRDIAIVIAPHKTAVRQLIVAAAGTADAGSPLAPWQTQLAECTFHFPVQPEPLGLADAVACAAPVVGDEPFVCYLPDNILSGPTPAAAHIIRAFDTTGMCTLGMVRVSRTTAGGFGNVGAVTCLPYAEAADEATVRITEFGDKRAGTFADGQAGGWRTCGLSVLTRDFLDHHATLPPNANGEWDDVPIFQHLAHAGRLCGHRLNHTCYDAGNPVGYAAAAAVRLPRPESCRV